MKKFHFTSSKKTEGHETRFYFQMYTIVFVICALFICSWFYLTGRTFISKGDGILQHYPALVYYAKYLRTILRNLILDHQLIIPNWDFSIGEGSDILATLHYYVIGDPFTFFSVFIPTRYMHLYYAFIILLRLYLSGIAFSCLCFQTGQQNQYGILAGSLSYVFCYWAMHNMVSHPYFLNPLLYMPMLLIGIEKIFRSERPYLFIFSVFLSAVSNFYFFYMLALITTIYVMVRIFTFYHYNFKYAVLQILRIGLAAIIGVAMGAVIFLPIFFIFINDTRMSSESAIHLFYPLSYYSSLPARFLTSGSSYWMCMGFAAPVLPAIFLLFYKNKDNKLLKILFLICVLVALCPFLGHVFNGFSYVTNRWSWGFALLCTYILTAMWPSLMQLKQKEAVFLVLSALTYFIICMVLEYSRTISIFTSIIFILFFLFLLFPLGKDVVISSAGKQKATLFIIIASIFCNSFWVYSTSGDDYASNGIEAHQIKDKYSCIDAVAVKQVADAEGRNDFWRYSGGNTLYRNGGFQAGQSSTSYYWTISNPYVSKFREELEINEGRSFNYRGYDTRTSLIALASVLYFVIPEGKNTSVPYGFTHVDTIDVSRKCLQSSVSSIKEVLQTEAQNYSVYRNDIPLSLTYTYDNVLSEETWNILSASEKQEAMLQGVFLKDYIPVSDCKISDLNLTSQNIDYTIKADTPDISIQNNSFVVTAANSSVTLEFDGIPNSETYFSISNLSFIGKPKYDLYFGSEKDDPLNLYNKLLWKTLRYSDREAICKEKLYWEPRLRTELNLTASTGINNNLTYDTEEYSWYNNRHDFIMNMGYSSDKITRITISFSDIGTYSFDSIEVICQPMENYVSQIMELRKNVLENVTIGTDSITGTITLDNPKILCFSIPYSIGWKAKVDGTEIPIYQANMMYMGIPLDTGEHDISLEYTTPFKKEGIYVSCGSLLILIIYVILSERRERYSKKK